MAGENYNYGASITQGKLPPGNYTTGWAMGSIPTGTIVDPKGYIKYVQSHNGYNAMGQQVDPNQLNSMIQQYMPQKAQPANHPMAPMAATGGPGMKQSPGPQPAQPAAQAAGRPQAPAPTPAPAAQPAAQPAASPQPAAGGGAPHPMAPEAAAGAPAARPVSMPGQTLYQSGSFGGGSQQYNTGNSNSQGSSNSSQSTQVVPGMMGVYNQLLGVNQNRYQNVLNSYQGQLTGSQATLGNIQGGYSNLGQDVANTLGMGQVLGQSGNWGVATPAAQAIGRDFAQQRGANMQGMINSGLGNTTAVANAQNQLAMNEGMAYGNLGAQLAQNYAGMESQIGQASLGAATQGVGLQNQLTASALGNIGQQAANTAGSLTGSFGSSASQQSGSSSSQGGGGSYGPSYGPSGGYQYPNDPNFPSSGSSGGGGARGGGGIGGGGGGANMGGTPGYDSAGNFVGPGGGRIYNQSGSSPYSPLGSPSGPGYNPVSAYSNVGNNSFAPDSMSAIRNSNDYMDLQLQAEQMGLGPGGSPAAANSGGGPGGVVPAGYNPGGGGDQPSGGGGPGDTQAKAGGGGDEEKPYKTDDDGNVSGHGIDKQVPRDELDADSPPPKGKNAPNGWRLWVGLGPDGPQGKWIAI